MWIEDKEKKDWIWKDNESDSKRDKWLIATTKTILNSLSDVKFKNESNMLESVVGWCAELFKPTRTDFPDFKSSDTCSLKLAKEMFDSVVSKSYVDSGSGIKDYVNFMNKLVSSSKYTIKDVENLCLR